MTPQACVNCGNVGPGLKSVQGYFFVELLLWVTFIIPGIAYSIWRYCGPRNVCPRCGLPTMVPGDTPRGQSVIRQWNHAAVEYIGGGK